jgi:hypothetical protein
MESGDIPARALHDRAEPLHGGRVELVGVELMKRRNTRDHPMTS